MTEGAPAAFADHADVASRWRPLDTAEQERATVRLGDASSLLRTLVPGIDQRIQADPNLQRVATAAVVDAVVRFLQNPEGAKQVQETIGPKNYGLTFDGRPSGIFFTESELASLRPGAGVSPGAVLGIGTARVGIRPGWAPW